jgi:hypothetical protein
MSRTPLPVLISAFAAWVHAFLLPSRTATARRGIRRGGLIPSRLGTCKSDALCCLGSSPSDTGKCPNKRRSKMKIKIRKRIKSKSKIKI